MAPVAQIEFASLFLLYRSVVSHQIVSCQVSNGLLYVSVGDGHQIQKSQQVGTPLGKVLRMALDDKPVSTNPFYREEIPQDEIPASARNYIWAMGFRNPFGLKLAGDRMFVADNGGRIDRFFRDQEGRKLPLGWHRLQYRVECESSSGSRKRRRTVGISPTKSELFAP